MYREETLKAPQIKAARALIDWSQEDLANASGISVGTVRKLELGNISPRGKTNQYIRQAFEAEGLEFLEPVGVRQRPEEVMIFRGKEGLMDFYDDVYLTAKKKGGEIVIACPNPNAFYADPKSVYKDLLQEYRDRHIVRMASLKDKITIKCLYTEDAGPLQTSSYAEYRWLSKHYVNSVPFYVYDDKYAVCIADANSHSKIVVLRSRSVADAFRLQFYSMWDDLLPIFGAI